ncbi:MAG: hypothetical protein KGM98_04040 [Bacteroidota bacterium]|nr:hypothetical protein [Bacteroidota bacterium]
MDHKDLLTDDLQVSPQARLFLSESARWGKFLSIVGFIFVGLMAVLSLFLPSFMAKLPPYNQMSTSALSALQATLSVIYFCMAALFFFPAFI